jgi:hypothetical protein
MSTQDVGSPPARRVDEEIGEPPEPTNLPGSAEDPLDIESPYPDPNIGEYWHRMPEEVREHIILRRKVWPRMHVRNENWMLIIVGETGSGKSLAAQRLAEVVDPGYSIEQTAWSVEEFIELAADDSLGTGSVQVLEEVGVNAGNRNWWELANQVLDALTQTWRSSNRGAIMTVPDFDLIDSHVQRRFHHLAIMEAKDESKMVSRARLKYIQTNHEIGKKYKKYHRLFDEDGTLRKFKHIRFHLPSAELLNAYEEEKSQFSDDLVGGLLERIRSDKEDAEQDDLSPTEVASKIVDDERVESYISESPGGRYVDRDLLKADYGVSESESKQVKKLLIREAELDDVM